MNKLTPAEKAFLVRCIQDDMPLPTEYLSRLMPQNACPQLVWPGKDIHYSSSDVEMELYEFLAPANQTGKAGSEADWHDKLMFGDNLEIMAALTRGKLAEEIKKAGGLKLIYIDPPFNAGEDFLINLLGQNSAGSKYQIPVYNDKWPDGVTGYLSMIQTRLKMMHDLLAEDGCIYVHCDWRVNSFLRLILDEIFPVHVNEICWHYTGGGRSAKRFSRKHDSILVYSKTDKFPFNPEALRIPYSKTSSYARSGITAKSGKRYQPNPLGKLPDDVWDIPIVNPLSGERNGYPTQKPEKLLSRILLASSAPGELVADFFCGSGTLPAVATRLGRKWIAVDNSPHAIHVTRKRLLQPMDNVRNGDATNHAFEIWKAADGLEKDKGRQGKNYSILSSVNSGAQATPYQEGIPGLKEPSSQLPSDRKICTLFQLKKNNSSCNEHGSQLNLVKDPFSYFYEYSIKVNIVGNHFTVSLTGVSGYSAEWMNEAVQLLEADSEKIILRDGKIFKISRKNNGCIEETVLSTNWTDWIDYWAVDACSELDKVTEQSSSSLLAQPFRPSWHSFRRRERDLELTSRLLPRTGGAIFIKIIDILANETIQKVRF